MEAKIRRERETLFLSSLAVIIFCVWGSAKVLFSYILDPIHWIKYVTGSDNPAITETGAAIIIVAYILVNFVFRLCIGLPAIKESRANDSGKRVLYLIFAVIFLVTDIMFCNHTADHILSETEISETQGESDMTCQEAGTAVKAM